MKLDTKGEGRAGISEKGTGRNTFFLLQTSAPFASFLSASNSYSPLSIAFKKSIVPDYTVNHLKRMVSKTVYDT